MTPEEISAIVEHHFERVKPISVGYVFETGHRPNLQANAYEELHRAGDRVELAIVKRFCSEQKLSKQKSLELRRAYRRMTRAKRVTSMIDLEMPVYPSRLRRISKDALKCLEQPEIAKRLDFEDIVDSLLAKAALIKFMEKIDPTEQQRVTYNYGSLSPLFELFDVIHATKIKSLLTEEQIGKVLRYGELAERIAEDIQFRKLNELHSRN